MEHLVAERTAKLPKRSWPARGTEALLWPRPRPENANRAKSNSLANMSHESAPPLKAP
jgi:hypothetical protein